MSDRAQEFLVAPEARSFVAVSRTSHFPLQNLPFGVFRPRAGVPPRVGVAIGDSIVDLAVLEEAGLFGAPDWRDRSPFARRSLNAFLALGRPVWREARGRLATLLDAKEPALQRNQAVRDRAIVAASSAELLLPVEIGDYTDFYSSKHHAINVGTMFRGADNALMPNWLWLPVAYHGRASSVVISGTGVRRPRGQIVPQEASAPVCGPSRLVDYELEMGVFVGPGNPLGRPIPLDEADEHLFGMVLVNDWSARDIQKWEYQPLGPFLGKNFATTISPWVVTLDALEPFRCAGPDQDPEPLEYLRSTGQRTFDITLEVWLESEGLREPHRLSRGNFNDLYWDIRQQLAHHTINGCNMRPGDLFASGTISGPTKQSRGCLLELAWRGQEPIALASGDALRFLRDGDSIRMIGWCAGDGFTVGFGECRGTVLPALP